MRKSDCALFPLAVSLLVFLPQLECSQGDQADVSCAGQMKSMGKIARFKPSEMKKRAIHKVDIDPTITARLDFRSTVVLEVVAAPDGHVECTRTLSGLAPVSVGVEKAVSQWKFKPLNIDGKPVATTGTLEFRLCNISCGRDFSMSILQ